MSKKVSVATGGHIVLKVQQLMESVSGSHGVAFTRRKKPMMRGLQRIKNTRAAA